MAIGRCPQCDLLMTEEEMQAGRCRACQARRRAHADDNPATRRLAMLLMLVGCTAVVAVVAMWLRGGLAAGVNSVDHAIAAQTRPAPERPATQPAETAGHTVLASSTVAAAPQGAVEQPPAPQATEPAPAPEARVHVRTLDDPAGRYTIDSVADGAALSLRGRVHTLVIGTVTGKSTLDATALSVQEIILTHKIDGQSSVKLRAPDGFVRIAGRVDGASTLQVDAPGAAVWFRPVDGSASQARIEGESRVSITARHVKLAPVVNGTRTRIDIVITRGGELKFGDLAGGAQVSWRKENPTDPEPTLTRGTVRENARFARVN